MRYVHNGGTHVYDDELDNWFRFDTPEEGRAFAMEVESREAVTVEPQSASRFSTATLSLFANGPGPDGYVVTPPVQILPSDMSRTRARIAITCNDQGSVNTSFFLIIGSRVDVMAGKGFYLGVSNSTSSPIMPGYREITIETTEEVWGFVKDAILGGVSGSFGEVIVSAISEYRG